MALQHISQVPKRGMWLNSPWNTIFSTSITHWFVIPVKLYSISLSSKTHKDESCNSSAITDSFSLVKFVSGCIISLLKKTFSNRIRLNEWHVSKWIDWMHLYTIKTGRRTFGTTLGPPLSLKVVTWISETCCPFVKLQPTFWSISEVELFSASSLELSRQTERL